MLDRQLDLCLLPFGGNLCVSVCVEVPRQCLV